MRWKQRFENFDRAVTLLTEPIARGWKTLSPLEKEGTAQRFEVALELAWKTLKDFLDHEGRIVDPLTPRTVVKEAFAAGILSHGQTWIDMIDHRNLLSHTYNSDLLDAALLAIAERYLPAMTELREWLRTRLAE